jgi:hypothetical protein
MGKALIRRKLRRGKLVREGKAGRGTGDAAAALSSSKLAVIWTRIDSISQPLCELKAELFLKLFIKLSSGELLMNLKRRILLFLSFSTFRPIIP